MLDKKAVVEKIRERMQMLQTSDACALFLLSVKEKEVSGVFSRFFRHTDILGYLGDGRYVVFLAGNITGTAIYEKTVRLVQTLRFVVGGDQEDASEVLAGVYVASAGENDVAELLKRADYALEMAGKDQERHFYIYTSPDMSDDLRKQLAVPLAFQSMAYDKKREMGILRTDAGLNYSNTAGMGQLEKQLDEKTAWLTYVAEHTDCQFWEVDVPAREFRLLYTDDLLEGRYSTYQNFPESLIECGRVHIDSAEAFRDFAAELLAGKIQGSGNFMVQYRQTSCYGWASMSYQLLCDEFGNPIKAIGIKEDLSYIPRQQTRSMQRRIMPADLYANLYCYLQANLSTNSVEKLMLEGRHQARMIQNMTYEKMTDQWVSRLFFEEDAKLLQKNTTKSVCCRNFTRADSGAMTGAGSWTGMDLSDGSP